MKTFKKILGYITLGLIPSSIFSTLSTLAGDGFWLGFSLGLVVVGIFLVVLGLLLLADYLLE